MSNIIKSQNEIAKSMLASLRERVTGRRFSGNNIVLLDLSESMDETLEGKNYRRIDALRSALDNMSNIQFRLFGFNNNVFETGVDNLIPSGGTALDRALARMQEEQPSNLIVITDGEPNNSSSALEEAKKLKCPINVVFVGSKHNQYAIDFCAQLAAAGSGQFIRNHLEAKSVKMLSGQIGQLMLSDGNSAIAL